VKIVDVDNIISLHKELIDITGGSYGIRDINLLVSAVNAPFATFDNKDLYSSIEHKAAILGFGIIKNHPFIDGNKRIGLLSMLVFLELNDIYLKYTDSELVEIGFGIADSGTKDLLFQFIIDHKIL